MGNENEMIPCLDFFKDGLGIEEGSEEWKKSSKIVKEALENHGCFILKYDKNKIPKSLCEDIFIVMKNLFDLPKEIKRKYKAPKPFRGYTADCPFIPLCQSFGIDDVPIGDIAKEFTNLMWPNGNPTVCETMKTLSSKLVELNFFILKMIVEGYGLPKQYNSAIEDLKGASSFRMMKYEALKSDKDSEVGLCAHTDKNALTILGQNDVQGIEVLTKSNEWIQLNIPEDAFVVIVGDTLKAWSNGRLHAATHRVMLSGDKERYSFALFGIPMEDVIVEVPPELVDGKIRYKVFKFDEYLDYYASTPNENAVDVYSGV